MRYRLYLDTSVIGAFAEGGTGERNAASRKLIEMARGGHVTACFSALVFEEVERASERTRALIMDELRNISFETLEESEETQTLAKYYVTSGVFAPGYMADARHIAIATVNEVDALVSWNFRHMVNLHRKTIIAGTNIVRGYRPLEIVTPAEVIADAQEQD
jgi:predicted nucleic acid-binding protein